MMSTQPGSLMLSEITEIPRVLSELSSSFASNIKAQQLLHDRKFNSIMLLARGTSDNAAHFFKYLIETKLGLPCGLVSPSAATMYSTRFQYENTLLIAISQSGQSSDLLAFAKAAQAGGGYLLSITNDPSSPLATTSDLHIPIGAGPELAVPATKSYVGQLFLSLLLTSAWAKTAPNSSEVVSASKKCLDDSDLYKTFASSIDIKRPIYVLGRGFSYPNAKEFALKLQETCLIPVQGMSSSDFLHGPIASLDRDSQVIFLAPHDLPKASFGEAPARVRAVTGRVFWIGSNDFADKGDLVLETPKCGSEVDSCISDAIAFQKVTHQIAISNNFNPDTPQGLNKVTITR